MNKFGGPKPKQPLSPCSVSLNVLDLSKIRFEISTFQHQENDLPTISKNVLLGFLK